MLYVYVTLDDHAQHLFIINQASAPFQKDVLD